MSYDEVRDVAGAPKMITSQPSEVSILGFAELDTDYVVWEYWPKKR